MCEYDAHYLSLLHLRLCGAVRGCAILSHTVKPKKILAVGIKSKAIFHANNSEKIPRIKKLWSMNDKRFRYYKCKINKFLLLSSFLSFQQSCFLRDLNYKIN